MTRIALISTALSTVLIGLAVPSGSAAAVADEVGATVVEQVSPVGPEGGVLPDFHVARNLQGATCKTHLHESETGTAYSCHVKFGYDPCWLTAQHAYVVCLAVPWAHKLTRLHVAKFINKGGLGKPVELPWGLLLTTGAQTTLITGKFGTAGGKAIHYTLDSQYKRVLAGPIDKSGPVWRIREARNNGRFRFKITGWVEIQKAWFGEPTQLH